MFSLCNSVGLGYRYKVMIYTCGDDIPVLNYPVRKAAVRGVMRAVADNQNAMVDGCRAVRTGIYAARIHLIFHFISVIKNNKGPVDR